MDYNKESVQGFTLFGYKDDLYEWELKEGFMGTFDEMTLPITDDVHVEEEGVK